jgi:hypothetical protein
MLSRWLFLPLLLLTAGSLLADSVTLVTGEVVSGTISSETPTEVTVEIPVSASITDERVIRREDISRIDKAQPDEIAYKQLIAMRPDPQNSYTSSTYDQILTALNGFATQYPTSTYLPEIQKLAATFKDEQSKVNAGEVKYLGRWLDKDEAQRREIQIKAQGVFGTMKQQAAAGDLSGAMQTFTVIEKAYVTTRSYPVAVLLARQILSSYQQSLVTRMTAIQADEEQLRQTIAATPEPEKSHIIAVARAEQDTAAAAIAASIKAGNKWVPLIPRSQVSIETLQRTVAAEIPRLNAIPVDKMNESIAKVDAARDAMSTGDTKTAASLLAEATQLWSANEAAHYWSERLKEKTGGPSAAASTPKALAAVKPTPPPVSVNATSSSSGAVPTEAATPFYMTIPGAIAIALGVLIVGGGVAALSKKKAQSAASAE